MADDIKQEKTSELDTLAADLYARRVSTFTGMRDFTVEAGEAYRKAAAFLEVKKNVRANGVKSASPDEPPGADCHSPNQRNSHPYNLVSRMKGDLAKVKRIHEWLEKNPTPETNPEELVSRLNRAFPDLGWDLPTVNVARHVFPAYANAKAA